MQNTYQNDNNICLFNKGEVCYEGMIVIAIIMHVFTSKLKFPDFYLSLNQIKI